MDDRQPPFSNDAECYTLCQILFDQETLPIVRAIVTEEAFYREKHRRIFRAMCDLYDNATPPDIVTTANRLQETDELEAAGGYPYLTELLDYAAPGQNVEHWAKIVRTHHERRQVIDVLSNGVRDAYDTGIETIEVAGLTLDRLRTIQENVHTDDDDFPWIEDDVEEIDVRPLLHGIGWQGMATLFWGREKAGKSTITRIAAAAVANGTQFLGGRVEQGTVLYYDEGDPTTKRKLRELGIPPKTLRFRSKPIGQQRLIHLIHEFQPKLTILDNLSDMSSQWMPGMSATADSDAWNRVIRPVVRANQDVGGALIWLHHAKKDETEFRDNTAIAAAFDQVVGLKMDGDRRKVEGNGRVHVPGFTIQYYAPTDGAEYIALADGEVPITNKIEHCVRAHRGPGISITQCAKLVGGRSADTKHEIHRLIKSGVIAMREGPRNAQMLHPNDSLNADFWDQNVT